MQALTKTVDGGCFKVLPLDKMPIYKWEKEVLQSYNTPLASVLNRQILLQQQQQEEKAKILRKYSFLGILRGCK